MNGLQVIDLKRPDFVDRMLRIRPHENAFIEINNLLATVPIFQIQRQTVKTHLEEYGVREETAKPRLLYFYSQVLGHFVRDLSLSEQEQEELDHLQNVLGLLPHEVGQVNASVLYPLYRNAVRAALADGQLSAEEKSRLANLARQLRVPPHITGELYAYEAQTIYQQAVQRATADQRLSPEEERELARLARGLNIAPPFDEHSQATLNRFRFLWRLSEGELPALRVPIHLSKGETCAAHAEGSRSEE